MRCAKANYVILMDCKRSKETGPNDIFSKLMWYSKEVWTKLPVLFDRRSHEPKWYNKKSSKNCGKAENTRKRRSICGRVTCVGIILRIAARDVANNRHLGISYKNGSNRCFLT